MELGGFGPIRLKTGSENTQQPVNLSDYQGQPGTPSDCPDCNDKAGGSKPCVSNPCDLNNYPTALVYQNGALRLDRYGLPSLYASIPAADGTETKILAGEGIFISGTGTLGDPYVITNLGGGSGGDGNNYPTSLSYNPSTGLLTLGRSGLPNLTATIPVPTGAETIITAGANITVTGTGTVGDPYVITGQPGGSTADGSETKINVGAGLSISGSGTIASPYLLTNTAPDQVVVLTAGAGMNITGTYPSFTIASTITQYTDALARLALSAGTGISYDNTTGVITNSAPDQVVALTQGTGIVISGTYPNFSIASSITQYTDALARGSISLTTTGSSGAATYNSSTGVLNIPQYVTTSVRISALTPANSTNTIDNGNFAQTWTWDSLVGNSGLTLSSSSNTTSGTQTNLLRLITTGTITNPPPSYNANIYSEASRSGNGMFNYAGQFVANGASSAINFGLHVTSSGTGAYISSFNSAIDSYVNGSNTTGIGLTHSGSGTAMGIAVSLSGNSLQTVYAIRATAAGTAVSSFYASYGLYVTANTTGSTLNVAGYFTATNGTTSLAIETNLGGIKFGVLSGTGTRMVVTDPSGNLSAQSIPTYDGSETKLTAGTNISITGTGTIADPYVITGTGGGGGGTVTSVSVVSANGFAGSVANPTLTPAITISTTVTGMLKGDGTAISAAIAGTDYQAPISLTTTGNSGAATFIANVLNIPNYTLAGLGGEPTIAAGTTAQYWRGDKTWQDLNTAVRLALSAGTGISYNNLTGVITNSAPDQVVAFTNGAGISVTGTYPNFTIASTITQYTDALARAAISLTTTGNSGAATYSSATGVFNIPNYTLAGLGGVATTRTINTQHSITGGGDLSADRTLNLVNDVASPGNWQYYGTNGSGTRGFNSIGIDNTLAAAQALTNNRSITAGGFALTILGTGTGSPLLISKTNAATNNRGEILNLARLSSGTVANNFGIYTQLELESAAGLQQPAAQYGAYWSNATDASRTAAFFIALENNASGTPSDKLILSGSGALRLNAYGLGTFTGTPAYTLAVDASGNLIEIPNASGGTPLTDGDKGDITVTASGATWTIDANAVTISKLQQVGTATFLGRSTAGTGDVEILSAIQATELLSLFTASSKGLVPLSGGGTTNFLRADGTWAAVSTSSAISSLTAATATNTINNLNFAQTWQWNTLAAGTALALTSGSTLGGANTLLNISRSGNQGAVATTSQGILVTVTSIGSDTSNIAGTFNTQNNSAGATNDVISLKTSTTSNGVGGARVYGLFSQVSGYDQVHGIYSEIVGNVGVTKGYYADVQGSTGDTFGVDLLIGGSGINYGIRIDTLGGSTNYAIYTVNGSTRLGSLTGTGTRMVVADANGVLSTQAIPSGASYTFGNGLTDTAGTITLGDLSFNANAEFNHSSNARFIHSTTAALGVDNLMILRELRPSEYGTNAAVGAWLEILGENQLNQEGSPTARKNVVYSLGYNFNGGEIIAGEGYIRLGIESNYRPGGGQEWFEFHAPEVKYRDGVTVRWYSVIANKATATDARHMWDGSKYTFRELVTNRTYADFSGGTADIRGDQFTILRSLGTTDYVFRMLRTGTDDYFYNQTGSVYIQSNGSLYLQSAGTVEINRTTNVDGSMSMKNAFIMYSGAATDEFKFSHAGGAYGSSYATIGLNESNSTTRNASFEGAALLFDTRGITEPLRIQTQAAAGSSQTAMSFSAAGYTFLKVVPQNDDALTQIIVRDATTGQLKYRTAASLGGGGTNARVVESFTATASQTVFTITGGYTVGQIDVYYNGSRLNSSEFTATNGTTVVLGTGAPAGTIIDTVKYEAVSAPSNLDSLTDVIITTATNGDVLQYNGTNWVNAPAPAGFTVSNSADNRILTSVTASSANAESSFTYDGSILTLQGSFANLGVTGTTDPALQGNLRVRGFSSLGSIIYNSYGAVGSNYYASTVGSKRTFGDWASALEFPSGGFTFFTGGNGVADADITWTQVMSIKNDGEVWIAGSGYADAGGHKLQVDGNIYSSNVIIAATGFTTSAGYLIANSVSVNYGGAGIKMQAAGWNRGIDWGGATIDDTAVAYIRYNATGTTKLDILAPAGVTISNHLFLSTALAQDDALTQILVRAADGQVKYRAASTLTANEVITLTGDVTGNGATSIATTIANNVVTYGKIQQASVGFTIMAKVGTGAGNYAELAAGTDSILMRSGSGDLTFGTIVTNQITNNAVSLGKLAQVATARFLGRVTAATGDVEALTGTQATSLLDLFSTSTTTKGLVPGSNGVGTTFFLRADGTWAVPTTVTTNQKRQVVSFKAIETSAITVGEKTYTRVVTPYSGTITGWYIVSNTATTATVDIWKANGAIPTGANTITGTAKPALSAASYGSSSTLTGWTTSVAVGDVWVIEIEANNNATEIGLYIQIEKD